MDCMIFATADAPLGSSGSLGLVASSIHNSSKLNVYVLDVAPVGTPTAMRVMEVRADQSSAKFDLINVPST